MTLATGIGSMPGADDRDYAEAVRLVLGELPLPHLPELPGRGPAAHATARALAVVADLGADLQPAGWRLTDAAGIDQRRARSLLAQDLDQVEEQTQDYRGPFKIQLVGPWTLAATVERPRGDKVLADHGARRDLAQALAEGLRGHLADVRRRIRGADRLVVQLDEPLLRAVLAGRIPTASGYGRHRRVDSPVASELLGEVLSVVAAGGGEPWVHVCTADPPVDLVRTAGAQGLSVPLSRITGETTDGLAAVLEAGGTVALGVVPVTAPATPPGDAAAVRAVLGWLDQIGLDPAAVPDRLGVTPDCGLAEASAAWVRQALTRVRDAATRIDG